MKMKNILFLLMLIFIGTLFAGCNNDTDTATNDTAKNTNDDSSFNIVTVRWSDWGDDFVKGFVEETEKEVGIDINWDWYLHSEWGEKKPVMLVGGELPDAFWGSITLNDGDIANNLELFLPLEDLIEEHMPNLMSAFEEDPKLKAIVTAPDGHIYSLPAKLPMRPVVGNQLFINKTWLDNLGLSVPQTWKEFYDVLVAFKEHDANGNGDPNDEIPYGGGNADAVFSFILPFGVTKGHESIGFMGLKNGKPVYWPIEDEYKEGIAWMHQAYKDGLIDPEIFTQDTAMSDAKRKNEDVALVGVAPGWTPDALFGPNSDEYIALPALEGPDGERYIMQDHIIYNRNELVITKAAKNPEKLLQFADKFYTEDASIQTFYGSFGIGVEKNEDGTYTVLPPGDGETADTWAWINSFRDFGPKYVPDGFNDKVKIDSSQGDGLKLELDKQMRQYAREQFPRVYFTKDELERINTLAVDLDGYVQSMQAKWVTEGGIEEEWDSYIAQLNQMGLQEYLEIHNTAYERYMKNLEN